MLEFYKNIVFLDLDMLISGSIEELFCLNCNIAWRNGAKIKAIFNKYKKYKSLCAEHYPYILESYPKPNGGLFVVYDNFDYIKCYHEAVEEEKVLMRCDLDVSIDELAFAHIAYKYRLQLCELNNEIYNVETRNYTYKTIILHFWGQNKPWNNKYLQLVFMDWYRYYIKNIQDLGFTSDRVLDLCTEHNNIITDFFDYQKSDNLCMLKIFCQLFSAKFASQLNIRYSRAGNYAVIPLSSDQKLHYEFLIVSSNVRVCLHFEGDYADKYNVFLSKEITSQYDCHHIKYGYEISYSLRLEDDPKNVANKMYELYKDTFPALVNSGYVDEGYQEMLTREGEIIHSCVQQTQA